MPRFDPQALLANVGGRASAVLARYREAAPDDAGVRHDLALVLIDQGHPEAALELLQEARRLAPRAAGIWNNLGALQEDLGRLDEAEASYAKAVELAPENALAAFNLGCLKLKGGAAGRAVGDLRLAATLDPDLAEAWSALGQALLAIQEPRQAVGPLRRAAELRPEELASHLLLGEALQRSGRLDDALACYRRATEREPGAARPWLCLGHAQLDAGRPAEALPALGHALELAPEDATAHYALGKALFELGEVDAALARLRQAAKTGTGPLRELALKTLAVVIPGASGADDQAVLEARREWGATLPSKSNPARSKPAAKRKKRAPAGRLKVGYLGSFFQHANWMKPVWGLVNRHDRSRLQVYLFSDAPAEAIGDGYRAHADDRFFDLGALTNEAAARRIARCELDLLVDLNGYSRPERLGVLALRPSPVIAGWFNLYATSGLACVDYLIGDEVVLPPGEEEHYVERILRVPGSYLTFLVDHPAPEVVPAPHRATGVFTFGCLASHYKLTDAVLASWSRILARCPESRLLVRNRGLGSPATREHFQGRLASHGVDVERVQLEGPAEHLEYLATYSRIDLALDSFPYNGGTTTMEALWQGVGVLSFAGDRWASRTSATLLFASGLDELVATDVDDFVERAVAFATDEDARRALEERRPRMRDELRRSPACDAEGFSRAMEELYEEVTRA